MNKVLLIIILVLMTTYSYANTLEYDWKRDVLDKDVVLYHHDGEHLWLRITVETIPALRKQDLALKMLKPELFVYVNKNKEVEFRLKVKNGDN